MSMFANSGNVAVSGADLVCMIMLLIMLIFKAVTARQDSTFLKQLNNSATIALIPLLFFWGVTVIGWLTGVY